MIAATRYLFLFALSALVFSTAGAQIDTNILKKFEFPLNRQLYNGYVDEEQKNILKYDGKSDNKLTLSADEEVNFQLTQAATVKIDWLQYKLETDSGLSHSKKVKYVQGLKILLQNLLRGWKSGRLNPLNLSATIDAYTNCVQLDKKELSIEPLIQKVEYDVAYPVVNATAFNENSGIKNARNELVHKYCILHPTQIFIILQQNPEVPFADSLVRTLAKKHPRELYDYAATNNKFGSIIRNINDDKFIKTIVRMSVSKSGQQYFPFLDNIYNDRITFEEIDSVKNDSLLYYKLLVKTQMDYWLRAINKDTAFEVKALTEKLITRATESFVNVINGLHTEPAEVRFRSIRDLTAEELYYLAVSSDGSIYTSSFVKGVYPLMMKKINNRGDSLLISVHFDKYRKFIKMSAGFNMLSNFLSSFANTSDADDLMKAFVGNLEKSEGLEDGVDVADSYASIVESLKPVADEMLVNILDNYQRNLSGGNEKGIAMYNILNKLFLSADTTKQIDLTKELGIPPVYEVPFSALAYDSGKVAVQLFIYGDKDGIGVFPGLISMFNNANWKIDGSNKQWVTITAAKGKLVSLYMNRPLPEETNEDAKAQEALCDYLKKNNISPTVTINRGHSYNAKYTIDQMSTASKIVFMGSCGGYRMIHDILEKAPDAHIVGTKQIADAPVNNPFLKLLMEKLRNGNNIEWIPFWKELGKMVTDKIFDDYVPPHKNLGALFIKAYRKAMNE